MPTHRVRLHCAFGCGLQPASASATALQMRRSSASCAAFRNRRRHCRLARHLEELYRGSSAVVPWTSLNLPMRLRESASACIGVAASTGLLGSADSATARSGCKVPSAAAQALVRRTHRCCGLRQPAGENGYGGWSRGVRIADVGVAWHQVGSSQTASESFAANNKSWSVQVLDGTTLTFLQEMSAVRRRPSSRSATLRFASVDAVCVTPLVHACKLAEVDQHFDA